MGGSSAKKIQKPVVPDAAPIPKAPTAAPIPNAPDAIPEIPTIPYEDTLAGQRMRMDMIKRLYRNSTKKAATAEEPSDLITKLLE